MVYHWRELPQVPFLSRQTRVSFPTNTCLSRQNMLQQKYACRDKTFVATKLFVATKRLARQIFVATNTCLSGQNTSFVATKVYFCRDKTFGTNIIENFCRDKHTFVTTKKKKKKKKWGGGGGGEGVVATKSILVAAPLNDDGRAFRALHSLTSEVFRAGTPHNKQEPEAARLPFHRSAGTTHRQHRQLPSFQDKHNTEQVGGKKFIRDGKELIQSSLAKPSTRDSR